MPTPAPECTNQFIHDNKEAKKEIYIGIAKVADGRHLNADLVKAIWGRVGMYGEASVSGLPDKHRKKWAFKGFLWYTAAEVVCAYHEGGIPEDNLVVMRGWKFIDTGITARIKRSLDEGLDAVFNEAITPSEEYPEEPPEDQVPDPDPATAAAAAAAAAAPAEDRRLAIWSLYYDGGSSV